MHRVITATVVTIGLLVFMVPGVSETVTKVYSGSVEYTSHVFSPAAVPSVTPVALVVKDNTPPKLAQTLYTIVRIRSGRGTGSGIVIMSHKERDGYHTYILTNFHVIADAQIYDSQTRESMGFGLVSVEMFDYHNHAKVARVMVVQARVVEYNEDGDMALLETTDRKNKYSHVANIPSSKDIAKMQLMDEVISVGCGLGLQPFGTLGMISGMDEHNPYVPLDDGLYWLISTPIAPGNSGGGTFRYNKEKDRYELLGITSAVHTMSGIPVFHMCLSIPPGRIRDFLSTSACSELVEEEVEEAEIF